MRGFRLHLLLAALSAGTLLHAATVQGHEWSGTIVAGVGARPDYVGSDDLEATPYVAGHLAYGPYYLDAQGQQVRLGWEVVPGLSFGPMMDIENGRDRKVKSAPVGRLPKIDDAFEAGGFVSYGWQGLLDRKDSLTLEATYLTDVSNEHDGAIGSFGLLYGRKLGDRWSAGGGVRLTYVDDKYAQAYFGISPAAALASGLPAFTAGGGIRDIGVSAKLAYALDENWSVQLLGSYKQLTGDFKDSPVVKREGSSSQLSGALAIGYRF